MVAFATMAKGHDADRGSYSSLITRRRTLKAAGVGLLAGGSGAVGSAGAVEHSGADAGRVDLGEEGLAEGDDIAPYIEEHFRSGNEVHVPAGSYALSNVAGLQREVADAALIGSEEGVELRRPDPSVELLPYVQATGGTVRIENLTIRGKKGRRKSRWRLDAVDPDATIEVVNVNHPDGTVDCSDSFAFYTGKYHVGEITYRNCYVADMGNSSFYVNQGWDPGRRNPVNLINNVVVNLSNTRHGTNGSVIRDNTFVWRRAPPTWKTCHNIARGPRWDQGGTDMLVENNHFHFGADIGPAVGCLQFEDFTPMGGTVRDVFVHTEGDYGGVVDSGGMEHWNFENVHLTGPGNTDHGDYDGLKHEVGPDLRNEDVVWMPESQTVRPGSGGDGTAASEPADDGSNADASDPN